MRFSEQDVSKLYNPAERGSSKLSKTTYLIHGAITLVAVLWSYAALDDITTDDATSFTVEYAVLVLSAVWCLRVASKLMGGGHFALGLVSALVVVAALWGFGSLRPGTVPSWEPRYVATVTSLGWFFLLSVYLLASGWKTLTESEESTSHSTEQPRR